MINHTGTQVRYWRMRRGLSREALAARVDRSTRWVKAVELGEREVVRLPVLERLATALGVTVQALTDPVAAQRALRAPDAAEVAAITGALGQYEVILGVTDLTEHPEVPQLARRVAFLDEAFLQSRFSSIGRDLPRVMIEAQRAAEEHPGVAATRVLVKTYRIASSTLLKLGADETAWLAADRAMVAAARSDDLYCIGRATRSVARAMTGLGRIAQSLDALLAVAARMDPAIGSSPSEVVALYGMVLLAAEMSAAKLGDDHTARSMHNEALAVAERWFPDGAIDGETAFGVTNVWLHCVSALVRLGRASDALDQASRVDATALARLPRERRSTYLLDVADAHAQLGQYEYASRALIAADRIAPEEARCRPSSKSLIATLINDTSHQASPELRALAQHAGVQI